MSHTLKYEQIIQAMPEGLEKKVLKTILEGKYTNPARRITRHSLVQKIFGTIPRNIQTSTEDRQIRRTIVNLQEKGIPIVSDSRKAGYYIGGQLDRENAIRELLSRRAAIDAKIQKLYRAHERNASLLVLESKAKKEPVQLELGGV